MAVRTRRLRTLAPAALVCALMAGCGGDDIATSTPAPDERAAPQTRGQTADQARSVRLGRVRGGLGDALYVTQPPGDRRLFVVQQSGRILILDRGRPATRTFLDIRGRISAGGERGLLGLAFHPRYAANGRFFVNYTDRRGDTRVVEFRRANRNRADHRSGRLLLTIRQPQANHNGGHLAFGPDRMLYIATGDGGGAGDPLRAGQRVDTLLGKLLRIDVDRRSRGLRYGIPAGNPFRAPGQRGEIYAYGLRNPWRFSFDRRTGDLWIGDVGQNEREEVNFRRRGTGRGANFGWSAFEGRARYEGGGPVRGRTPVRPVAEYTHSSGDGCSITGGYVYRGRGVPALRGRYVYADFCTGKVWAMRAGPRPGGVREITRLLGRSVSRVTSFGEDRAGNLYLVADGALYRFVGR